MKKKLILLLVVILFLVLSSTGFFLMRDKGADNTSSAPSISEQIVPDGDFLETPLPDLPDSSVTDEALPTQDPAALYGPDLTQEELDELGEGDNSSDVPSIVVDEEFVIELEENQASGSL